MTEEEANAPEAPEAVDAGGAENASGGDAPDGGGESTEPGADAKTPECPECAKRKDAVVESRRTALEAGKPFARLRRQHRILLSPVVHDVVFTLSLATKARDRLRCPQCTAVGTFKPHGGLVNFVLDYHESKRTEPKWPTRMVRRWLCKNCGYYIGPEGTTPHCFPKDVWRLPQQLEKGWTEEETKTPKDLLMEHKTWPWFG